MVKILEVDTVVIFFYTDFERISSRGTFLRNTILFSSVLKGDIGEEPTFLVSSCEDYSAKPARWGSKNSSDSDELDLGTGSCFFFSKKNRSRLVHAAQLY